MAKENRTINGTIRFGGKLFNNDSLDEFESAATPEQIARLTEKGTISGFDAKADKAAAKAADESEAATTPAKGKGK